MNLNWANITDITSTGLGWVLLETFVKKAWALYWVQDWPLAGVRQVYIYIYVYTRHYWDSYKTGLLFGNFLIQASHPLYGVLDWFLNDMRRVYVGTHFGRGLDGLVSIPVTKEPNQNWVWLIDFGQSGSQF